MEPGIAAMADGWLLLETSGRSRVGVAVGGAVVGEVVLGAGRAHNRHLVPTVAGLLARHGLDPKRLAGVAAGTGPGSYTGLRVGLTAAKTLAYALGCSLVGVPTFEVIAADCSADADLHVVADALNGTIYWQPFALGLPRQPVGLRRFDEWAAMLAPDAVVAGPGTATFEKLLPAAVRRSPVTEPSLPKLLELALCRRLLTRDALMALEPLYLRGSSAEEKRAAETAAP